MSISNYFDMRPTAQISRRAANSVASRTAAPAAALTAAPPPQRPTGSPSVSREAALSGDIDVDSVIAAVPSSLPQPRRLPSSTQPQPAAARSGSNYPSRFRSGVESSAGLSNSNSTSGGTMTAAAAAATSSSTNSYRRNNSVDMGFPSEASRLTAASLTTPVRSLSTNPSSSYGTGSAVPTVSRSAAGVESCDVVDELVGFSNIGNTCFMNSTLQCLLRCQRIRNFLLVSDLDRVCPRAAPLTNTLQDICRRMHSSSGGSVSRGASIAPSNFKSCLASYKKAFAGYEQHDAHEFLRFTLDAMHDECNQVTRKPGYEELKDIEKEPIAETARRWMQNHTSRNVSIVQDAFCGQFASEMVCQVCQYRSVSCETFLDLSLPVPRSGFGSRAPAAGADDEDDEFTIRRSVGRATATSTSAVSLSGALDEFFATVTLANEDAYQCPKCKKPSPAQRSVKIYQLPEVLVIHLKRFRHSRWHASKINDVVDFPTEGEELDLSKFLHHESRTTGASYRLIGVVHHMGSVHSGHYVASCRVGKNRSGSNPPQWFEFNDSMVDVVRGGSKAVVSASAYILFFERLPHDGSSKL